MTPWRIAIKLRGECSYHTPIRVVLSTNKLRKRIRKCFTPWIFYHSIATRPRINPQKYFQFSFRFREDHREQICSVCE
jgi:hypothetical protein